MQGSAGGREALPKIEADMRELERTVRSADDPARSQRLLGPVPVLQDAAPHTALHPAQRRRRERPLPARRPGPPAPPDHGHRRALLVPGRHHPRACAQRLRPAIRAGSPQARCFAAIRSPCCSAARKARARADPPTSSATCRSPPIARCACACATATTSRSASPRCPIISSATRNCVSRSAPRRPSSTTIRTQAARWSRRCRRAVSSRTRA